VAAGRHQAGQRQRALRVLGGDDLGDRAAERGADDVRLCDAEGVEQTDAVGGHVGEAVGGVDRFAGTQEAADRRDAGRVEFARQAAVAVVEADDAEAARDERLAQFDRPAAELCAEPHDQQDGRRAAVAEGFVFDLQLVGGDLGHDLTRLMEWVEKVCPLRSFQ
jgi:hypothetical protein